MSSHDATLTLRQIVEFGDEITSLLATRTREDLDSNREFVRALERCVELIGEAVTRLPSRWRDAHPEIPWRQIIAMRNVLIHGRMFYGMSQRMTSPNSARQSTHF